MLLLRQGGMFVACRASWLFGTAGSWLQAAGDAGCPAPWSRHGATSPALGSRRCSRCRASAWHAASSLAGWAPARVAARHATAYAPNVIWRTCLQGFCSVDSVSFDVHPVLCFFVEVTAQLFCISWACSHELLLTAEGVPKEVPVLLSEQSSEAILVARMQLIGSLQSHVQFRIVAWRCRACVALQRKEWWTYLFS